MKAIQERLVELTREVCRLYGNSVSVQEAVASMQDQYVSAQFVKGVYEQLSMEANNLTKTSRKNAEKHKFYCIQEKQDRYDYVVAWTSRYFLEFNYEAPDSNSHQIKVFDSFNDKFMQVTVKKSGECLESIYPLDDDFGLFYEYQREGTACFISLVFLDLYRQKLEKLTTIEYPSDRGVIVNKIEPTEFLVFSYVRPRTVQFCKVEKISIVSGEIVDIDFFPQAIYDGHIYGSDWIDDEEGFRIYIYNIEEKTTDEFDLRFPDGYYCTEDDSYNSEWVRDRLYCQLRFVNDAAFIGFTDTKTRQWTIMDFSPKVEIRAITWFEQGDLIARTDHDFYKISLRKPDRLQNLAWLVLVKAMKKRVKSMDPYEAARRYLPYNSMIRCPFVKPDPNEKRRKLE